MKIFYTDIRELLKRWGMESLVFTSTVLFACSAGIGFVLFGCAPKKIAAHVVVERPCITKIELSDHTRCTGPDSNGLKCTGLVMTVKPGCDTLQVNPKEKQK